MMLARTLLYIYIILKQACLLQFAFFLQRKAYVLLQKVSKRIFFEKKDKLFWFISKSFLPLPSVNLKKEFILYVFNIVLLTKLFQL